MRVTLINLSIIVLLAASAQLGYGMSCRGFLRQLVATASSHIDGKIHAIAPQIFEQLIEHSGTDLTRNPMFGLTVPQSAVSPNHIYMAVIQPDANRSEPVNTGLRFVIEPIKYEGITPYDILSDTERLELVRSVQNAFMDGNYTKEMKGWLGGHGADVIVPTRVMAYADNEGTNRNRWLIGDCEMSNLSAAAVLLQVGYPRDDVRVVGGYRPDTGKGHAWLEVRVDGNWTEFDVTPVGNRHNTPEDKLLMQLRRIRRGQLGINKNATVFTRTPLKYDFIAPPAAEVP